MSNTFEQEFAENLAGFGWSIPPSDLPDAGAVGGQLMYLRDWTTSLTEFTRDVLRTVDLTDAISQAYGFINWPGQYELHSGRPFEEFPATLDNLYDCWTRAWNAVQEQDTESIYDEAGAK
jgi:hypothetical protein